MHLWQDAGMNFSSFSDSVLYLPVLITLALVLKLLWWPSLPFRWMEVFFHELSHGLACLLTFGRIVRIELNWDGSGVCYTRGGWRLPVLLAGYSGAVCWGAFMYYAGWVMNHTQNTQLLFFLCATCLVSMVLWGRDLLTWLLLGFMAAVFYGHTLLGAGALLGHMVCLMGVYVMVSAVRAPLNLIDGLHVGDGAALQDITLIPEIVWVLLWFFFALAVLYGLWELSLPFGYRFFLPSIQSYFL